MMTHGADLSVEQGPCTMRQLFSTLSDKHSLTLSLACRILVVANIANILTFMVRPTIAAVLVPAYLRD